jgi:hypothetical protein
MEFVMNVVEIILTIAIVYFAYVTGKEQGEKNADKVGQSIMNHLDAFGKVVETIGKNNQ